jgi:hypothetical protein
MSDLAVAYEKRCIEILNVILVSLNYSIEEFYLQKINSGIPLLSPLDLRYISL